MAAPESATCHGGQVTVELPSVLQQYAGGRALVPLDTRCTTAREALAALARRHPGVVDRVLDERGEVRQHVNIFIDERNIRFESGLDTPVGDGSTLYILAAVSGG